MQWRRDKITSLMQWRRDKFTSLMQWRRDKITSNVHSLKICGALEGSDLDHPDVIVLQLPVYVNDHLSRCNSTTLHYECMCTLCRIHVYIRLCYNTVM